MLIGITGSFGAGKGSVARYLVEKKGFTHFSARTYISEEIKRRGMEVNRDTLTIVGNDLRKTGGPTFIFEELVKQAKAHGKDAVVESVRAVAEAKYIKLHGGVVLGVDAEPKIRYERIVRRGAETDHVSYERWREQEMNESNPDDPTKQDIYGALRESDYIINNTKTLQELEEEIEHFLKRYT